MCIVSSSAHSGLFFVIIVVFSIIFNCLHFGIATFLADSVSSNSVTSNSNNNKNNNNNNNNNDYDSIINNYSHINSNQLPANNVRRRHINITRKRSVHLNGIEIDENSIFDHLHDHERELIFGKSRKKRAVKLVHLKNHLTDAGNVVVATTTTTTTVGTDVSQQATTSAAATTARRVKRADTTQTTVRTTQTIERQSGAQPPNQEVSIQIQDNDHLVNLKLHPTPKLIDDAFIFIRRSANTTQLIENSHKLAERLEHCFYSNENSALDLCDDENVRGVYHYNSTDYIIHPLPERFGNTTHVILESNTRDIVNTHTTNFDEHLKFEPDEVDFKEPNLEIEETIRQVRNIENINSTSNEVVQREQKYSNYDNRYDQEQSLSYMPRYKHNDHHYKHHKRQHHHNKEPQQHHKHNQQKHHQQQQQNAHHNNHHHQHHHHHHRHRSRRYIASSNSKIPPVLHIETAIFVDSDLFKHMTKNFPKKTEHHMLRFVLAMINGVQLLYHHPSLGRRINFVLKRLEILNPDPIDLRRSPDIDVYLSNFCKWQNNYNSPSDGNNLHYDHAVILTGLDLYVMGKNGKEILQVVGLAPVAGMCMSTSSCTINEGKHFESVFVVAHEIGHNLGMRHDTTENSCDPSLHIMSPTLGSGKTTWSSCSRAYLNEFLGKHQAKCLFDSNQFVSSWDHTENGKLPGERFDADQQCMLKYGRDSKRAKSQKQTEICRDLHCQRDRHTWTSHPALEGTECSENMWCRTGKCVQRPMKLESYTMPSNKLALTAAITKPDYEKANFAESNNKLGQTLHGYNSYNNIPSWGDWDETNECASGCLYGPSKRLREGSTGLRIYSRSCLGRRRCLGRDRKYESCIAKQCYDIPTVTIEQFATQICEKAQKSDPELTGVGQQVVGDLEESCKIICKTKSNGTKSRRWTFPDGTTCRTKYHTADEIGYCISGRCETFTCDNSTNNYYKIGTIFCQYRSQTTESSAYNENDVNRRTNHIPNVYSRYIDNDSISSYYNQRSVTTMRSKYENEVALRNHHGQSTYDESYKRKMDPYQQQTWNNKYDDYHANHDRIPQASVQQQQQQSQLQPIAASLVAAESEWIVKSGCHSSCMAKSKGVQVVSSRRNGANNIQLCQHTVKPCERLLTPAEYAETTCARYKLKVRGLSGHGNQIAASVDEPDRSCRVGCQDEFIHYRYYLVNGKYGLFPLGTKCSPTEERYCVNGKCLEFGRDDIPLQQSHISLALFRNRRSVEEMSSAERHAYESSITQATIRHKRSFLYYEPVNITETITQEFLNGIVKSIINFEERHINDDLLSSEHIEFTNPIHITNDKLNMN